jgi:hypothetical protein
MYLNRQMLLCYMFYYLPMLIGQPHLPLEVVCDTINRLIRPQLQMIDITIPKHLSLPFISLECTFNSHDTSVIAPFAQMN